MALWIAAGANLKEVAARAGHASASFTLERYGHLYPEADLSLRERLDVEARSRPGTGCGLRASACRAARWRQDCFVPVGVLELNGPKCCSALKIPIYW